MVNGCLYKVIRESNVVTSGELDNFSPEQKRQEQLVKS